MPDFIYDIGIDGDFPSSRINWGSDQGWLERERGKLDAAAHVTLIPKESHAHSGLPLVTIQLGEGRRWIVFSRVFGQIAQGGGVGRQVRLYCLGWQMTVRGVNVQCKTWVYPNGVVEVAEEPTQVRPFLEAIPFVEVEDGPD